MTMTKTFKVQLNITKKPYDRPVHFKVDGARFQTADKTVVVTAGTEKTRTTDDVDDDLTSPSWSSPSSAADKTVKFNVNAKYIIDFTFRPPQVLE